MSAFSGLTYTAVLLAVLAEQLYLPIPSGVFLMAAGALSARGEMRTSIVVSLGIVACLAADSIWFWFGRKWGSQVVRLLCRLTADPRKCSRNAHEKFNRYGLSLLCVAKFFPGLGAVLPPLVGAEGVSLARFLALDALGAFLWSGFYVELGYLFSNELDVAIRWVRHFGTAPRYRDWGSDRSLFRVAWTGFGANDPSPSVAPHQPADARSQTEIQ